MEDGPTLLVGVVATDGSCQGAAAQRHGGWAAVQGGAEDLAAAEQALYGHLPFPRPAPLLAELWAVLCALEHARA